MQSTERFKNYCVKVPMFRDSVRIYVYFLLFFCCVTTFGFAQEKISTIEEMRKLYEKAEAAMSREDYPAARVAYMKLLKLGAKEVANDNTYMDVILRLAAAEARLQDFQSAEARLRALLKEGPDERFLIRIEALRAQFRNAQGNSGEAYTILKNLEQFVPLKQWPSEEKSFLVGLEYSLNKKYGDLLRNAERLAEASLFEESVPLFEEVLEAIDGRFFPAAIETVGEGDDRPTQVRYRLAEAYFHVESYGDASVLLEKLASNVKREKNRELLNQSGFLSDTQKNVFYLLGLVYQEMGKREHAISSFFTYLKLDDKKLLTFYNEVQWQLGLMNFQRQDYEKAEEYFKAQSGATGNIKLYYLGRLYLARIYLQRQDYEAVEHVLFPLLGIFTNDESLRYEASYLRAEAFFQKKQYEKAAALFHQAIPKRNKTLAEWYPDTLYNLAWCYLKMGEANHDHKDKLPPLFDKGEAAFQELISFNHNDQAYIGLARLYMLRARLLGDPKSHLKASRLLEGKGAFSSIDQEAEAILLRGEAAGTYSKRVEIFDRLAQDVYAKTPYYGKGWYFKGINDLQQGQKLLREPRKSLEVRVLFDRAILSFEKAFELLKDSEKSLAGLSLKYAAQAHFYKDDKESRLEAYALFNKLFNEHGDIFAKMKNRDELLYLQGIVASRLLFNDKLEDFLNIANQSLTQVVDYFPKGKYADNALNLLGTIHFKQGEYDKAERAYTRLAVTYPKSKFAGEAWFFAGESAQWQRKKPEVVREYRKNVFEKYSDSKYGNQAYFKYYSFTEYMQGNAEALSHLQNMELLYPQSPYLIVAHYLVGMNHKQNRKSRDGSVWKKADYGAAIHAFEESQAVFDRADARGFIPSEDLVYFITVRYRALLERALIKLRLAEEVEGAKQQVYLEWAAESFEEILKDFHDPDHPLARVLTRGHPYPRIFEESEYGLVRVYITAKEYTGAEELLSLMLEKYSKANVRRGYYLSRAWYEQGRIAMMKDEHELALKFFNHAENTARGRLLNTEQRLDLWVQQSHCYREMEDYNTAMLTLSKVINEDVVSPLRLKSMFLRAEIYELEGRHDLAIKQLEATAKIGGDWAYKAKEKLEKDYGFN
ncbi:MAG: tetratricopeptide (TPR) repeat protein [Chlamydiales bacterium]